MVADRVAALMDASAVAFVVAFAASDTDVDAGVVAGDVAVAVAVDYVAWEARAHARTWYAHDLARIGESEMS